MQKDYMKIKKIIALMFVLFLSTTASYCSQEEQSKDPLFFDVITLAKHIYRHDLVGNSRNVTLFLKKEDEGMVLCLHDQPHSQDSHLPLLLPAAFRLCKEIEKTKHPVELKPKQYIQFDVDTKDKLRPILCTVDMQVEANEKVCSEFLEWVRQFSA